MTDPLSRFEQLARRVMNYGEPRAAESRDVHPFDERNIHSDIAAVSLKLFDDGHYSQATFEAFKRIENEVKSLSGIQEEGFSLMMNAFKDAGPKIKLTDLVSMSDKNVQSGFRHVFAGVMSAIRNPRGHDILIDPIDLCLDHLSVASVLLRMLENRKAP